MTGCEWSDSHVRASWRPGITAVPSPSRMRKRVITVIGKLLKNRHAGHEGLAWNLPSLAGPDTLALNSPDFTHEGTIGVAHASKRIGGKDLSPALTWAVVPDGVEQLLLVVEDPDAPTKVPNVHC